MTYPVYYPISGDTLPVLFDTFAGSTGASITMTGLATTDIEIYKDGGTTQRASDNGYTLLDTDGIDFDGITGIHGFSIDLSDNSDAGFYTVGPWYHVVVSSVTVDSQTVSFIACAFRILDATRGMAGTALPDAAADAAGGVPISDAGGLDLDTMNSNVSAILSDTGTDGVVLANDAITAAKIAANAITSSEIADGAITAAKFAAGAIDAAAIADGAIDRATFAADTGLQTVRSNTAQAGAASSITLDASASSTTDYYAGRVIYLTGGAGVGQARIISAYNGTTKIATITPSWATNPASGTTFAVLAVGDVNVAAWRRAQPNVLVSNRVDASVGAVAANAITATGIASGAITNAKFASGAIDAAAIATDAIGAAELAADAVTEIQSGLATSAEISALNDLSAAEVNTEVDTALADVNLDHLVGTATGIPAVPAGTYLDQIMDDGTAAFDRTTDSLQAIRDRGDSAWTTGAGGSDRLLMVDTTIATLTSQTSFTLTAGSDDDNAYVNCTIVIEDASTSTQKAVGLISAYTGSTKTVTLKYDPGIFTMAVSDKVYILAENSLKSTDQNRQLDVTSTGAAGVDWGNVENPTTAVDLSATDIQLADTVTTLTGHTAQTGDNYARLGAPAGASVSADIASIQTDTTAIVADTNELQTDDVPGLIAALNDPTSAAIADAVWDEPKADHTTSTTFGDLATDLDSVLTDTADMQPKLGTPAGADISADIAAIKTDTAAILIDTNELQTDDVPGLIAALNDLSAAQVNTEVDNAFTTQIADSVPADGTLATREQALYMILQFLTEKSVSGTTVTVKKVDGSTSLMTFTLDDGTTPTSITRAT